MVVVKCTSAWHEKMPSEAISIFLPQLPILRTQTQLPGAPLPVFNTGWIMQGNAMQEQHMTESVLTGMLYCVAGSLIAGIFSAGLLILLVRLLS